MNPSRFLQRVAPLLSFRVPLLLALVLCAATTAKATPGGVAYPDGVLPNAAMTGEIIEFSLSVENTGDATIEDVWVELSIHEPSGAKIENSHTDFIDPETQNIGLIYWESQGSALPPGAVVRYAANYCLSKSVTGWVYIPGNYRLKYRAWRGQPGSIGAEPLSEIYEEPLTIGPISAPNLSVPILMYHRVDDTAENEYWVLRDEFESQMKALVAYGYQAISTEDIFNYNYSGGALPPKPVVITFDDGYEDMYTHAYPVLLQESLFGEFYIVTGSTESSPLARRYSSFFKGIKGQWNPHLTWPEIIEMAQDGMLFGSHTRTHRDLTTLTDEELESELLGSQQDLYSQGGILATSFSYPYGAGDDDAKIHQLLARYGYLTAVSAWQGVSETRYAQPLDLKRVYVYGPHPAADPDSNGVSVDYDPAHPNDFFMRKLDSDFPLPDIVIESVEFLDDLGNPRANNLFDEGETATVRVLAHNNGEDANVILSLNLDIDSGLAPLIYESHQTSPSQDIHRYFPTTTGTPEVFEFQWQIPPGAESGVYDYSLEFRDDTYILGYALTGWVEDSFNVCANIHLLGPPKGSNLSARPTFSWNPGCNSSFVVDFSYDAAFATTVRTTPVLTTSSFPVSTTTWNKTPKNKRIYWRVRGADLSVSPVEIETSQETWWFVRY